MGEDGSRAGFLPEPRARDMLIRLCEIALARLHCNRRNYLFVYRQFREEPDEKFGKPALNPRNVYKSENPQHPLHR
jgi:hypothetical protein